MIILFGYNCNKKIELKIRIINKKVVENREKLSTVGAPQSRNSFNTNKSFFFFLFQRNG